MDSAKKSCCVVGIVFIYLLSFVSVTATIVRLVSVLRFHSKITQRDLVSQRIDYSYWAILEIMTAIMCANLPALSALYRRTIGKDSSTFDASGSHANTGQAFASKRSFSRWVSSKSASLRQHSTVRPTVDDNGVAETSETNLTGYKGTNEGIAFTEIEMNSPIKGSSYSTCETVKEEEQSTGSSGSAMPANVPDSSITRLNKMVSTLSSGSSPPPPPNPNSVEPSSIGEGEHGDRRARAAGIVPEGNEILQTREVTVRSSLSKE